MGLPAEFSFLYRLFLRASSATTLHNATSKRCLRRLYRPSFEAAATIIHRLQCLNETSGEAETLRRKLAIFDERGEYSSKCFLMCVIEVVSYSANNALAFMLSSSRSRGLPHDVMKQLTHLELTNYYWVTQHASHPKRIWDPQLPHNSEEYTLYPPTRYSRTAVKSFRKREEDFEFRNKMWGPLGEAIQMSQGRDNLICGKAQFNRRKFGQKHEGRR
jgi:hypothetical protein